MRLGGIEALGFGKDGFKVSVAPMVQVFYIHPVTRSAQHVSSTTKTGTPDPKLTCTSTSNCEPLELNVLKPYPQTGQAVKKCKHLVAKVTIVIIVIRIVLKIRIVILVIKVLTVIISNNKNHNHNGSKNSNASNN